MKYKADKGYLIVAGSHKDVDYLSCAVTLAKSIKYWHPHSKICLLTDNEDYQNNLFDYVVGFPYGNTGGWTTDWQVFHASPFHETIKLESDMVLSGSIDHWWTLFRNKKVWISTGCKNFHGEVAKSRRYRKIFDKNNLPDVYNAITYWRMSKEAQVFFRNVKQIFTEWETVKTIIQGAQDELPNTDLVYALCAEKFITPGIGPQIVHMKPSINGTSAEDWSKELVWEIVDGVLRINGHNQTGLVHYHQKHLAQSFGKCYG